MNNCGGAYGADFEFGGGIVKHCGDAGGLRGSERLWRAFLIRAEIKQGCFNSGRTKSLQGRSDTNDRRRNHNYSSFIIHYSLKQKLSKEQDNGSR